VANSSKSNILKELKKSKGLKFLAIPPVLVLLLFNYIPLYGLLLPFKNYWFNQGIIGSPWAGFENFKFFLLLKVYGS